MVGFFKRGLRLQWGVIVIAMFALVYTRCSITDPVKNIALVFNTLSISTTASVNFADAATGEQIGSASQQAAVKLTFTGPDADKIVTTLDEPMSTASTPNGVLDFGITSSFTPGPDNPVRVTLVASSGGYQTTSYPLVISSTGSRSVTIHMVKNAAPPPGTSTAGPTQIQTGSTGQTTSTTDVQTNPESTTGGSAGITIATGTAIKDESGNPLSGSLTVDVTYFSNSDAANGALPTGLSVGVVNQDQSGSQGYIQAGAFATFTVADANGHLAKTFSAPVTLSFTISGSTINPNTGAEIKNGDTVPVYSFDENSQTWKFEVNGTASGPDARGNYTVTFQATHLSSWLAGWIAIGGQVCTGNITLNINGSFSALMLKLKAAGVTLLTHNISGDQNHFVFNDLTVPKGVPVTLEAYDLLDCPATLVGATTIPDLCAANTINLDVSPVGDRVDVDVDVTAICPHLDPPVQVRPSGYDIFVVRSCGPSVPVGTLKDGKITLKGLRVNTNYTFGMIYKNTLYTQQHLVDKASYVFNYDIVDSVCNADFK